MAQRKMEVEEYVALHNLETRLTDVVNQAIASGSPNPLAFIADLLTRNAVSQSASLTLLLAWSKVTHSYRQLSVL